MTDRMIRRFKVDGLLTETAMEKAQLASRSLLIGMMKDEGFVPLIDLDPVFKTKYLGGEKYEFSLTMHGVFVGKDIAWQFAGMLDGKLLPNTAKNK
jgi:hypothetical protein